MKTFLNIALIILLLLPIVSPQSFAGTYIESKEIDVGGYKNDFVLEETYRGFPIGFNLSCSVEDVCVVFNSTFLVNFTSPGYLSKSVLVNGDELLIPYYVLPQNSTPLTIGLTFHNSSGILTVRTIPVKFNVTSLDSQLLSSTSKKPQGQSSEYLVLLFIIPLIAYILLRFVNRRK